MVAEVVINSTVKKLNKVFDYNIPEEIKNETQIGARVLVPFGNRKKLEIRICYQNKRRIKICQ